MKRGLILAIALLGLVLVGCIRGGAKSGDDNGISESELYVKKGYQYMLSGRLDVAQQDLNHAIELDSRNAEAHNAMGILCERLKQPEAAEEHFRKAVSLDDNNPSAFNNLGRLLCAQGKYDLGMKQLRLAMESKTYQTPWLALTNAGLCVHSQGQLPEAETYLRKALEYNPTFAPALLDLAKLSLESNNFLSARAFLERFNAVSEPTAESLSVGYQAEEALGNQKEATNYLKKLRRFFPTSKEAQRYGGQRN